MSPYFPAVFPIADLPRLARQGSGIAQRILGNKHDAEDAVQEAWIAALNNGHSFDSTRAFAPWFNRIVANKALNALARRRRRPDEMLHDSIENPLSTPDQEVVRDAMRIAIDTALQRLSARQRQLVQMVDLDGYSAADAAIELGITSATARWHLHEARGKLRDLLHHWS